MATYFFRPRITRIAPETNAKALDALPTLISGATAMSAKAKPETATRIRSIPAALSIVYPPYFCSFFNKLIFARSSTSLFFARSSTSYIRVQDYDGLL
jgi:hypothetical protein